MVLIVPLIVRIAFILIIAATVDAFFVFGADIVLSAVVGTAIVISGFRVNPTRVTEALVILSFSLTLTGIDCSPAMVVIIVLTVGVVFSTPRWKVEVE